MAGRTWWAGRSICTYPPCPRCWARCATAGCARWRSPRPGARASCRTRPRWPSPATRASMSRPGTASSRRRAHPRPSCSSRTRPSIRRWHSPMWPKNCAPKAARCSAAAPSALPNCCAPRCHAGARSSKTRGPASIDIDGFLRAGRRLSLQSRHAAAPSALRDVRCLRRTACHAAPKTHSVLFATETHDHAAFPAFAAFAPAAPVRRRLARAGAGGPARRPPAGAAGLSGQPHPPAAAPSRPPPPPPARPRAEGASRGKPIRLVVPFLAGGGPDMTARTVAQKMAEHNGWSVLVDNRPGASGNLGVDSVAKSAPDGHTLVLGQTSNLAINPALYPELPYDPLKDLVPVALVSSSPMVLVTHPKSAFKTYADVVAAARMQPDTITLGFSGSTAHLAGNLAENAAGIQLRQIPYKGAAQGMTDLVGGQIDLYLSSVTTLLGHVRNRKLPAIVLTSARRSGQLPDTPTLAESGYPGFDALTWFGILAPAGTPAAIVQQLNRAINQALAQPAAAPKLRSAGGEVLGGSAERLSGLLRTGVPRWGKIVKDSGASMN